MRDNQGHCVDICSASVRYVACCPNLSCILFQELWSRILEILKGSLRVLESTCLWRKKPGQESDPASPDVLMVRASANCKVHQASQDS